MLGVISGVTLLQITSGDEVSTSRSPAAVSRPLHRLVRHGFHSQVSAQKVNATICLVDLMSSNMFLIVICFRNSKALVEGGESLGLRSSVSYTEQLVIYTDFNIEGTRTDKGADFSIHELIRGVKPYPVLLKIVNQPVVNVTRRDSYTDTQVQCGCIEGIETTVGKSNHADSIFVNIAVLLKVVQRPRDSMQVERGN